MLLQMHLSSKRVVFECLLDCSFFVVVNFAFGCVSLYLVNKLFGLTNMFPIHLRDYTVEELKKYGRLLFGMNTAAILWARCSPKDDISFAFLLSGVPKERKEDHVVEHAHVTRARLTIPSWASSGLQC
eukprot:m.14770 g.14770  ORF g.14770 m.14770 type:complete len:128 (-) comp7763_c0_seq1:211-594(-)